MSCIDGTAYGQPNLRIREMTLRDQIRAYVHQNLKRNRWYLVVLPDGLGLDTPIAFYQFSTEANLNRFMEDKGLSGEKVLVFYRGEQVVVATAAKG